MLRKTQLSSLFAFIVTCGIGFGASSAAHAEFVVAYTARQITNNENETGVIAAVDLVGGGLVVGQGLSAVGATPVVGNSNVYITSKWTNGDTLNADEYLSFGFTSTRAWSLTEVGVSLAATATGPSQVVLRAFVGGNADPVYTSTARGLSTDQSSLVFNLESSGLQNVEDVEFRLHAFGADNLGVNSTLSMANSFTIDSGSYGLYISGLQAVPEPTSLALAGVACSLMGFGAHRRKKRRATADAAV